MTLHTIRRQFAKLCARCVSLTPDDASGLVLEPRSNTLRRNVFELDLVESLALADRVVLASVFKSESIPAAERLHPEHVVTALDMRGTPAALFADADAIVSAIVPQLRPGDVVAPVQRRIRRYLPEAAVRYRCAKLATQNL